MEPVRYSLVIQHIRVVDVYERIKSVYVTGVGKDAIFDCKSLGWWVRLLGSREAIYAGDSKPSLEAGDLVTVRITKECDSPHVLSLNSGSTP